VIVDSSALLAIVLGEPDFELYIEAVNPDLRSRNLYVPASVLVEAGIVAEVKNKAGRLDQLLAELSPEVVPLDRPIAQLAREAFRRFGKGRHKASLNFGNCLSYATAQYLRQPLLYKGDDFRRTDVRSALRRH
jgi:ribonuclease VapC